VSTRRSAEAEADQQPPAAGAGNAQGERTGPQVVAHLDRVGDETLPFDHVQSRESSGTGDRPAAEGAAQVAEGKPLSDCRRGDHGADGEA
jgi:hypothetical protein